MTVQPSGGGRLAIFTICSNNYMPFARVLFDSLSRHHPEAALFLCLADRALDRPGFYGDRCTMIEAEDLSIPDFPGFAFRYDIMEFNTALKPFMFLHLLEDRGFDAVIYLDPDIAVFAPLAGVIAALRGSASFFLTPHLCAPNEDPREPNDLTILRSGAYNLGFLGVSRSGETAALLGWWARRLLYQCINAQAEGIFVDQKFMDLIPSFAEHAVISHDTTLNVAYWNLAQRALARTGQGWTVDGAPLTFFHFSGFNPDAADRLSKHDPRFRGDLAPALAALTAHYAACLRDAGYGSVPVPPYAYGRFASGTAIHAAIRAMFRDGPPFQGGDPFAEYEAFLDEPWPGSWSGAAEAAAPGSRVTHLMQGLRHLAPPGGRDPLTPEGAARLVHWFVNDAAEALALDPALIAPAAGRLGEGRPPAAMIPTRPDAVEMTLTVTAPLAAGGVAGESARLTLETLFASGLAVEMRDGGVPTAAEEAPIRIICLSADRIAAALPGAAAAAGNVFRILVPVWDHGRVPDAALPVLGLGLVEEVWAPSRFIQSALAGCTDRPVIHMPLAIERDPVAPLPSGRLGLPEGRFTVLSFFDGQANPGGTDPAIPIRAFRLAFPGRGTACLMLALEDGPLAPERRRALEEAISDDPDILLVGGGLTRSERLSLIAACDAMLSLCSGDALGLTIARAMLLDRPVIALRHAAGGEFVTEETGYPVDYRLVPAADGSMVAEADTAHAAWIMQRLAEAPSQAAPRLAQAGAYVRRQHGGLAVAARQQARLLTLGLRPRQGFDAEKGLGFQTPKFSSD